jgi:YbbR domain-containing protein
MRVQDFILRNFWLKFFSVALAVVIWLSIHYDIHNGSPLSELSINHLLAQEYIRVPVTIVTNTGDARVFRLTPSDVVVIAVGSEMALRRAANNNIKVTADVTDIQSKGPIPVELQSTAPQDVTVVELSPATVTVQQVSPQR